MFTGTIDFNESALSMPHDIFVPDVILAQKGDTVVIHFHNLEDTSEHHTFTMTAPYAVDKDVAPGQDTNITFVADSTGLFTYTCKYHQPTMTGHFLVVA